MKWQFYCVTQFLTIFFILGTAFSQELVMNFLKHRENIMENVSMLSAIYLDPRFSFELTDVQREQAMMNIMNIRERLNSE